MRFKLLLIIFPLCLNNVFTQHKIITGISYSYNIDGAEPFYISSIFTPEINYTYNILPKLKLGVSIALQNFNGQTVINHKTTTRFFGIIKKTKKSIISLPNFSLIPIGGSIVVDIIKQLSLGIDIGSSIPVTQGHCRINTNNNYYYKPKLLYNNSSGLSLQIAYSKIIVFNFISGGIVYNFKL